MPSATFSHTTTVSTTPESIDIVMQRPGTWQGIGPIDKVWDATHQDGNLTGFKWSARAAGRSWDGTAQRTPTTEAGMISFDLDSSEIAGTITVSVEPSGPDTVITVKLSARSKGILAGMFWGVVADAMARGLPAQVEVFGEQFS